MALADNIALFPGVSPNDYDANLMLEAATRADLENVVILGWDKDGEMFFSSSMGDGPECLWLIEKAKAALLRVGED